MAVGSLYWIWFKDAAVQRWNVLDQELIERLVDSVLWRVEGVVEAGDLVREIVDCECTLKSLGCGLSVFPVLGLWSKDAKEMVAMGG